MNIELLKREIKYRGARRGLKETDLTLGGFIAACLDELSAAELLELRDLCFHADQPILGWLTGEELPPAEVATTAVWPKVLAFHQQRQTS